MQPATAQKQNLEQHFEAYSEWRQGLAAGVTELKAWLQQQELSDSQVDQRLEHVLSTLRDDKLYVAFVAEFSRGKSELINAIFFADFGQRLLPSSAGRTTMCPTELLYDASRPPSIRLLPIETRLKDATVTEFKEYADEWVTFPLDLGAADRMAEVLARVSQVK
ncbi:MAG: dynamin family protein, partial [Bacteroidota bacterium]